MSKRASAVRAIRTVHTDQRLRIFISHKHEDTPIAQDLAKWITQYHGEEHVQAFLSEGLPAGVRWHDALEEELAQADVLMLLYTDAHQ